MGFSKELEGKILHDHYLEKNRSILVPGPIIVGAGPSGLAVAACLKERGVPSLILERESCIASLWRLKTYDRLRLHLPKQFCQLPFLKFPEDFPTYPTKQQFLAYLECYRSSFGLEPVFNTAVVKAEFDPRTEFWRVKTVGTKLVEETEYVGQWLVVATGENGAEVVPEIEGMADFDGPVLHTSSYKSGEAFSDKEVLVVGCGNSGMEVCLDLCNYNACPSLVVRNSVHVLPQEMLGRSTFGLSMWLLKWLPVPLVDRFLLFMSRLLIGDTTKLGLHRPGIGPLQLKNTSGKTPVLDVGTLAKIKSGHIKVFPAINRIVQGAVVFIDGRKQNFDSIILATGYSSNVPLWLKENKMFSVKDGMPKKPFPNGWKGESGLYAVGFTKRGLLGASTDATRIAQDIYQCQQGTAGSRLPFPSHRPVATTRQKP